MKMASGSQDSLSNTMKFVHAIEYLRVNPSCVSTLLSISRKLSNVRESDTVAKQYVTQGILDILPSVIRQSSKKVVILGLEIMGALSLSSRNTNHLLLTKKEAIYALIEKLTCSDVELLTAACHTLEDVLILPENFELVKDSLSVEDLLRMLFLLADLSGTADTGLSTEGDNLFDELPADRIETPRVPETKETFTVESAIKSSNAVFCNEFQTVADTCIRIVGTLIQVHSFKDVPRAVYLKALSILQQHWLWLIEEDERLYHDGMNPSTWDCCKRSKSRHEVAKCLMLFGMEYDDYSTESEAEKSIGIAKVSTLEFREKFWERSPILLFKALPSHLVSFAKKYDTMEKLLNNLVSRFTACPPAAADQLDPLLYFREVEFALGDPLIYGLDIRIVKTDTDVDGKKTNESEVHFDGTEPGCGRRHVVHKTMLKAVTMGFSLAIRSLQLRCGDIARVADALAKQFGQPSVGVNLYVTPPNAQGLAVHFDDHCVLVCQLQGHKSWEIFPPVDLLPRLYDSRSLDVEALKNTTVEQVRMEEGNVLYIPRGYPHKAFCEKKSEKKSDGANSCSEEIMSSFGFIGTSVSQVAVLDTYADPLSGRNKKRRVTPSYSESAGDEVQTTRSAADNRISVHLTFGVEVEPPFEWEGLVHIALRLWVQQTWRSVSRADSVLHSAEEELCEALLHAAIKSIGDRDIRFRKACLIAADTPSNSHLEKPLDSRGEENRGLRCSALYTSGCESCCQSSLTYFQGLIDTTCERVTFSEALKVARSYLENEADEVHAGGMEWLKHIPNTEKYFEDLENSDPLFLLQQSDLEKLACEKLFTHIKDEFGQALMFHDATQVFKIILDQYRAMRKKSRNGILALHGGLSVSVEKCLSGSLQVVPRSSS